MNWLITRSQDTHPFADFEDLFDDMFRGFGSSLAQKNMRETGFFAPQIDVQETEKAYSITAELPGLDEKDIQLEVADGMLTLKGEKKQATENKDAAGNFMRMERRYGQFMRQFSLPEHVDEDAIQADFSKGVLTLTLPKTEKAATPVKKIAVKAH